MNYCLVLISFTILIFSLNIELIDFANVKFIKDKNVNISGFEQTLLYSFKALDQLLCLGNCMKTLRCNLTTYNLKTNQCNNYKLSITDRISFFDSKDTNIYFDIAPKPYNFKGNLKKNYSSFMKISYFALLADETIAAASSDGFSINIYNNRNLDFKCIKSWQAHFKGKITALMTLKNGDLISASTELSIKIWDFRKNWILKYTINPHTYSVLNFDLFSNGNFLTGSADRYLKVWNPNDASLVKSVLTNIPMNYFKILNNGDIAVAQVFGSVEILKSDVWSSKASFTGFTGRVNSIVQVSNDYLATGSVEVIIWNLKTYTKIKTFFGHTGKVTSLVLLQNGLLASSSYDMVTKIWDIDYGLCLFNLTSYKAYIDAMIELPNGYLIVGGWSNRDEPLYE